MVKAFFLLTYEQNYREAKIIIPLFKENVHNHWISHSFHLTLQFSQV